MMLLFILFLTSILLAQRPVSMNFELYQNAANNIIAIEGNFPMIYSGNIGGNSYYFVLEQPTVQFDQNYMKMIIIDCKAEDSRYVELYLERCGIDYDGFREKIFGYLHQKKAAELIKGGVEAGDRNNDSPKEEEEV